MAGTSVLKLKVDDKEYNASLKQAQQGLQHLGQALNNAGKSFTQVDKSVVDYVRSIGQMEAQSKSARGRIGEMSNAFIELSLQYKNMSDEVKSSDVGKALAESMEQLKQRTVDAKNELDELNKSLNNVKMPEVNSGGGGLFSGMGDKMSGAIQVFAGNMMTKAAGAVAELGSEIFASVQQGIELARQGEGIRIAFERLGRGDILDGLRQATHGTVTDLELMKAAVKFNDFKLPVEELGTMLAFAQQKAKDTGQSVDYMVDSIVTGLGRKSLMILDNLGLSATEVKEKMAETGDMTKAVGQIIREQMAKAGDYVETAADRAAQANVSLQNKMEELGRKFAPVEEASNQLWTSMKIGILDVIDGPLLSLLNYLNQASRSAEDLLTKSLPEVGNNVDDKGNYIKRPAQKGAAGFDWEKGTWKPGYSGAVYNAATGQTELPEVSVTGTRREIPKKNTTKGVTKTPKTEEQLNNDEIQKLTQEYIKASDDRQASIREEIKVLQDRNAIIQTMKDEALGKRLPVGDMDTASGIAPMELINPFEKYKETVISIKTPLQALTEEMKRLAEAQALALTPEQWSAYQTQIEEVQKKMGTFKGDGKSTAKEWGGAAQAINAVGSAMQSIEDPAAKVAGTIAQAIATIALTYAKSLEGTFTPWDWIAAAASGAATMISVISSIHSATGYANGGMVKGNSYSGDNIPAMIDGGAGGFAGLNAGEVVLNAAQQNSLAQNLQGSGLQNLNVSGEISGESIKIVLNRHLKRTGQGEIVTW